MTKLPKRPFELVKINKGATGTMSAPKTSCSIVSIKKPQGNLTPSVSIAPVTKKPPPATTRPSSDSESEPEPEPEPEDTVEPPEEKIAGMWVLSALRIILVFCFYFYVRCAFEKIYYCLLFSRDIRTCAFHFVFYLEQRN